MLGVKSCGFNLIWEGAAYFLCQTHSSIDITQYKKANSPISFAISGLLFIKTIYERIPLDSDICGLHVRFPRITFWKYLTIGHLLIVLHIIREVLGCNIAYCNSYYSISQEICTRFCCALLCCGYAIVHNELTWSIYPYSSGLLCWHWGNR